MNAAGAGILGLLFIIAGAGALLGLPLLVLGLRGRRIDAHPICRKCGFDLVGVPADPERPSRCPECGADVSSPKSVRIGNRRRRRGMVVMGSLLVVAWLGAVGTIAWSSAVKFNWNTIKPYWLLMRDAQSQDSKTTEGAAAELLSRMLDDKLTPERASETVALGLDLQADKAGPWTNSWADLLDAVNGRNGLSDEQRVRYIRNGALFSFALRPQVLEGDSIPFEVRVAGPRLGKQQSAVIWTSILELTIDGTPVPSMVNMPLGRHAVSRGRTSLTRTRFLSSRAPGKYTVRATVKFEVHPDSISSLPPLYSWAQDFEAPVEILPADSALYSLIEDPAIEEKMRSCFKVTALSLVRSGDSAPYINITLNVSEPPQPYACDVIVRAGGRELVANTIFGNAGQETGWGGMVSDVGELDTDYVDVILRPSTSAMKESLDLTKAWGKEIIIKAVPLKRPGK